MRKLIFVLLILACVQFTYGQELSSALKENLKYTGAVTKQKEYKAIFQLDTNNPDIVKKAFRNIRNVLKDARLIGKIKIQLITFSGGTDVVLKNSAYVKDLEDIVSKGVQVSQCANSLEERNLKKEDILDFIPLVPSGTGELIIKASQGWVIIKP